jgi:hypothetical protein
MALIVLFACPCMQGEPQACRSAGKVDGRGGGNLFEGKTRRCVRRACHLGNTAVNQPQVLKIVFVLLFFQDVGIFDMPLFKGKTRDCVCEESVSVR